MATTDIPIQVIQDTGEIQADQSSDCCQTTDDGSAYCAVPQDGQSANCGCDPKESNSTLVRLPWSKVNASNIHTKESGFGQTIRGAALFAVACITSPCCTPLIVPLALALLAGTPVAAWLGQNLGWVYGGLTLVSIVSFVLALRWMRPKFAKLMNS